MSLPSDSVVRQVLGCFGVSVFAAQALGNQGGFSGAQLWRVSAPADDWCLRAFPKRKSTAYPAAAIHAAMKRARDRGLTYVPAVHATPEGDTLVEAAGRSWELVSWLPGRADFHARPTRERLRSACIALAHLHRAWCQRRPEARLSPCRGVRVRLDAARDWCDLVASGWRPEFVAADPISPLAERAWHTVLGHVPRIPVRLAPYVDRPLPSQLCLCDIWHDNVLFDGDSVSGIVDYGSVMFDSVAVDLARLLGSLVEDDADAQFAGLEAYASVRPLSVLERSQVRVLDETGVLLGIANWLRWLYHERRQFEDRRKVAERLAELVRRVEQWE